MVVIDPPVVPKIMVKFVSPEEIHWKLLKRDERYQVLIPSEIQALLLKEDKR